MRRSAVARQPDDRRTAIRAPGHIVDGTPAEEVDAVIRRETGGLARRAIDGTCRMGTPLEVESPGLMTGLAGVGHGLLRLAAPDRIPSVLLLE